MKEAQALIAAARAARRNAYAPYSGYEVGAALLAADGRVFAAGNVENASYGLSICAERGAVAAAVAAGARRFVAVAIATRSSPPASPCGMCRQTLAEFCDDMEVFLVGGRSSTIVRTTIGKLLPRAFRGRDLRVK